MKYLNKPYDLLEIRKIKIWFSIGTPIFFFLFLYVFEPFGLYNLSGLYKLEIISLYIGVGLIIGVIHMFWLQKIIINNYTLRNTILWLGWITLLISISSAIINDLAFNEGHFYFLSFIVFIGIIFGISIIPLTILILVHYIYLIKKQIKITSQINKRISEKNKLGASYEAITIMGNNKRDNISIKPKELLYIQSADNYVDVYYSEGSSIKHNLLRNTLNNVEKQLLNNTNDIIRCHNSYIVNADNIESISGNATGYKIGLRGVEVLIPISKKYKDEVLNKLSS